LDVPDVATVIHTAPPIDASIYTHRSGRTGRAGKRGKSVLFAPHYRRRFVERMVWDAGIELKWLPIPNTNQVRKQVAEKARAALEAELVAALEAGPATKHLEHAQALLEGRDPAALVAVLLARLQPASRGPGSASSAASPSAAGDSGGPGAASGNEPRSERRPAGRPTGRPVADSDDGDSNAYPPRSAGDFAPRSAGDFVGRPSADRYGAPARFERSPRRGAGGDAVRFFMNWGINQGATPGRLLAAVCRRGQVQGSDIGSIAIHPNASTFSVRAEVAEQFEDLAGRRDQRDPQIVIRRDRALH
jgi:ATP-dependent RNA helicase DeaD